MSTKLPAPPAAAPPSSRELAGFVAAAVVRRMRELYPEPMRHASGGIRKTLHATVKQEAFRLMGDDKDGP